MQMQPLVWTPNNRPAPRLTHLLLPDNPASEAPVTQDVPTESPATEQPTEEGVEQPEGVCLLTD